MPDQTDYMIEAYGYDLTAQMDVKRALEWEDDVCSNGTWPDRQAFREKFEETIGEIPKEIWDQGEFTLGIEYGIRIAIAKIFGALDD